MQKPKLWKRFAALALMAALVIADQAIKAWMTVLLTEKPGTVVIPGILGLHLTQNSGISFSLFGGSGAAMMLITGVTICAMVAGVVLLLSGKLVKPLYLIGAALVLSGGVGNLVDRLRNGWVVDYLEFLFVRFAIFNFADVCIICGVALLMFQIILEEAQRVKAANKA